MWSRLSHNQQRFAVAMLQCASKKEAAEMIGLEPQTVYRWNGDVEQIVAFMRNDYAAAAVGILAANNAKAHDNRVRIKSIRALSSEKKAPMSTA